MIMFNICSITREQLQKEKKKKTTSEADFNRHSQLLMQLQKKEKLCEQNYKQCQTDIRKIQNVSKEWF